ncbi:PEP-CTERM sorting domain-containing protein [Laspinema olomoucense]|uniref:PEP-CTERM sorting domain-containing protein n=1 Tax=Laspinema olomoucense TaxID=3231600 RepID=UPI0021BAAAE0|nr:PEP-CTERM sorting domain-containing protein [Laspinema sp. D3d]MCT7975604.1 PEP-CTERM sorting domain-containing protein [Laspinema sp. D3d]
MTLNLLTRSTLAITGAVFSLGVIAINPAHAARITYDFSVPTYGPDGYSSFTGRLSYDEATNNGWVYEYEGEDFPQWGVWRYESQQYQVDFIEFSFLDRVYTKADALSSIFLRIDYANRGEIGKTLYWETEDFSFVGWSYRMEEMGTGFQGKKTNLYDDWNVNFSRVQEEPTPVPEPSILGALSVVGLAGLLRKKRVKAME